MTQKKKDPKAKVDRQLQQQRIKNLESALKLERTGLLAITKVLLRELPPARQDQVLEHLDTMVRHAIQNPNAKEALRTTLVSGRELVARALEQELGRPQQLFDPNVGHIKRSAVNELIPGSEEQEQLGIGAATGADIRDLHTDRTTTYRAIQAGIMKVLRDGEAGTDAELWRRYTTAAAGPPVTRSVFYYRRTDLVSRGLLRRVPVPEGQEQDVPRWDLTERIIQQKEQASA